MFVSAPPAQAAVIASFTGPTCANGTAALLGEWAGAGLPGSFQPSSAGDTISLNTTASGYPAGSVRASWASATGAAPEYESFTPVGAGLASQYGVPSLELGTTNAGPSTHVIDITFPEATAVYFPMLDVDTVESGSIQGFNGAAAVAGTATVRNSAGSLVVTQTGTVSNFNAPSITNYPDTDDRGMLDVTFTTPVTRIRIVDTVAFGSNEIGNLWGCQSQDLVKAATTPAITSATASTVTYHTDLTFSVGNSQPAGGMRVYAPQVTDNLATALSGAPTFTAATVTNISATGPAPACTVNSSFTGVGANSLLAGTGHLSPGEQCVISVGVDVTYPFSATPFTKNNTSSASGAGTSTKVSDASTNGAGLPGAPKGDTASPTPLDFPAFSPAIDLVKTADRTSLVVGETITYTFAATNIGNVPLSAVTITEGTFTGSGTMSGIACPLTPPVVLAPGSAMTCTATYVVTQADVDAGTITNDASVTGAPPVGVPVTDVASASISGTSTPAIALVKSADKSGFVAGETITYSFTATNTGNVTLAGVGISEGAFTGSGTMSALTCTPNQPAALAPGDTITCSATYVTSQSDVDAGGLTNHATATGTPPTGSPVTSTDQVTVPATRTPALSLVKTIASVGDANGNGKHDPGDVVTYQFVTTNTGNVTLTSVNVAETAFSGTGAMSAMTCSPVAPATLAPGQVMTCTATYVVTQSDAAAGQITNTAIATGQAPDVDGPITVMTAPSSAQLATQPTPATPSGAVLAFTGAPFGLVPPGIASALLVLGLTLVLVGRRRKRT